MSSYVTEFFMRGECGICALEGTSNHVHSTIQTTSTISYICQEGLMLNFGISQIFSNLEQLKTTRDDMKTFETDLKSLNLILEASE